MIDEKSYLVQLIDAETSECNCKLLSANEIIQLEDSMDYNEVIKCYKVFDISIYEEFTPIIVKGKHCNPENPSMITGYRPDGSMAFSGTGTEH